MAHRLEVGELMMTAAAELIFNYLSAVAVKTIDESTPSGDGTISTSVETLHKRFSAIHSPK